jgi:mannose-6-phosphate isomerase-like protein (cupin superfamily)
VTATQPRPSGRVDDRTDRGTDPIATGRPLDDAGEPTDGPALLIDPGGVPAELLRRSPHALASSPGMGMWATVLSAPGSRAGPSSAGDGAIPGPSSAGDGERLPAPAMLVWLAPDATELPPHVHDVGDETFRALDGRLTVVKDGEPRRLDPGETYTVEAGREHSFRNDTGENVAFHVEPPWWRTVETQLTAFGLDHEGAFGGGGGGSGSGGGGGSGDVDGAGTGAYGEPGLAYGLVTAEYLRDGTTIAGAPRPVQRALWATVGRVARALGYRAVEERFLRDEYWERTVEQPDLSAIDD